MDLLRHSIAQWLCHDEHGDWRFDPDTPKLSDPYLARADRLLEHIAQHLPDAGDVEALRGRVVTDGVDDKARVIEVHVPAGHECVVRPSTTGGQ